MNKSDFLQKYKIVIFQSFDLYIYIYFFFFIWAPEDLSARPWYPPTEYNTFPPWTWTEYP